MEFKSKNINKCALIAHPSTMKILRNYIRFLKPEKTFNDQLLIKLFEWADSYKYMDLPRMEFNGMGSTEGIMIMVPFLPQMKDIARRRVAGKVLDAVRIASENNCTVGALGAFTSIVLQGKEQSIGDDYGIRLTSGNTLTTAVIIRSIEKIVTCFDLDLSKSCLGIIGASGDIGSACFRYFLEKTGSMILTARNIDLVKRMVETNMTGPGHSIEISTDNKYAASKADVCILVSSSTIPLLDLYSFKSRSIVCDASVPQNVTLTDGLRPDVFLYHGGITFLPFPVDPGFNVGLATPRCLPGCQTEGILLAVNPGLPCSWGRGMICKENLFPYLNLIDSGIIRITFSLYNKLYSEDEIGEYSAEWKNRTACYH